MSATPAYPIFPEWLPQLSRQSSSAHAPSSGWQTACRQGICSICPQVTSNEKLNGHIAMKCQNHLNSVLEHTYACRSIGCVASKLCVSWIAVAPHAVHNKSIPNTHRHMCIRRDATSMSTRHLCIQVIGCTYLSVCQCMVKSPFGSGL